MPDRSVLRKKALVSGLVQGVGFRPFVFRLAKRHALSGWVRNTSTGVEIDVQGDPAAVNAFIAGLSREAPPLAEVRRVAAVDAEPAEQDGFRIIASAAERSAEAAIPADIAVCDDCLRETSDPSDRRFAYPFTNCTNCGPRFTIVQSLPYDRPNTTMSSFAMCPQCAAEYENPLDRRFHAEPIACPACGPRIWLEQNGKRICAGVIGRTAALLRAGRTVAVKGLGGFHLACDARNDAAVERLRERKGRVSKPFALMVRDLAEAEDLCYLTDVEKSLLLSRERPIALAKRRAGSGVSQAVAPANNYLGLMLPYTPLHAMLLRMSPPALVMTSGNLSEEPLAFTNEAARVKLGCMADALLLHNREIDAPCDDSVLRPMDDGHVVFLRRARGFVPNVIHLPVSGPSVLACGVDEKNTFCLAWGDTAVLSQHIGDLDTAETVDYFEYAVEHYKALFGREPGVAAHDMHPGYQTTLYARDLPNARLIGTQHHHAHIASCLAENSRTDRAIGVALDGTGYGPDASVWGGEILIADLAAFTRFGHFATVRMPGGEAAVRDPRRMTAAYLHAAYPDGAERLADALDIRFTPLESAALRRQIETGLNSPVTSSAGRLFDAVSVVLNICRERTYEGQPAIELEMASDESERGAYPCSTRLDDDVFILDTLPIFKSVIEERLSGVDVGIISARFHNSLVDLLAAACQEARDRTGLNLAALSGGVFQNGLILKRLHERLDQLGFEVLTHRLLPPNDGGLSLGQAAIAAALFANETEGTDS